MISRLSRSSSSSFKERTGVYPYSTRISFCPVLDNLKTGFLILILDSYLFNMSWSESECALSLDREDVNNVTSWTLWMLSSDIFLLLSLLTCLLEDRFPNAVPYVYQIAAIMGFGHLVVSRMFLTVFDEYMRFWYNLFYLAVALANVVAVNLYLARALLPSKLQTLFRIKLIKARNQRRLLIHSSPQTSIYYWKHKNTSSFPSWP